MHSLILPTAALLAFSSAVHGQQAVQWRLQDGGNGHWYRPVPSMGRSWQAAQEFAELEGGHLVCISNATENGFVKTLTPDQTNSGYWLGAFRNSIEGCSPSSGWQWVDNTTWQYSAWAASQPDCGATGQTHIAEVRGNYLPGWHDFDDTGTVATAMIEWSADCNSDGIVDYGQCRDGSLPDFNGNNIPDCCESSAECIVGNYPVQWRTEDGGNGHWYEVTASGPITWATARANALSRRGHLATFESNAEFQHVASSIGVRPSFWIPRGNYSRGPWIGAFQDSSSPTYAEPAGGWRWVTGELVTPSFFAAFGDGNPNNYPCCEDFLQLGEVYLAARVNDQSEGANSIGFMIEWDSDCNGDGLIDKGQILRGQLDDADGNSIPDTCENSCPGDITNGGTVDATDLSIVLAAWGSNGQGEFHADIDGSGLVDGGDLALVLGGWGPCPN